MNHISVYIDTNCINARGNDFFLNKLEKLYDEEKILIEKTDTLDTELREGKGYPAGEKKSSQYVESFGQALVGHSRVGTSLVGDPDDSKRLSRILTLLWGSKPQSAYKKNCLRDSMHLSTAIRYGGTFFVTGEKAILNKAQLIEVEFGIKIRNPKDCLTEVEEMIRKYELYKKDI